MSFSIEKIVTVKISCFKCNQPLERYIPQKFTEYSLGAQYKCPRCKYKIIIQEV